ncbi:helix-turn-helix domain-containing protein [Priestia megaterium]|uniref:helix-turn-helix domain-containing protein n=1 Tax=Priestia megaterium TaxID=1404 RepID=UPI000BF7442A|nr:helix-turn-helix domain-containing protein [Priestia megaterium]PFB07249.1 helix-turn-helix domain-containing protein [Priestia megaterium]
MYQELAKKYRSFDSKEALNYSVRKHLYHNKHLMTPTAIAVLKVLSKHAVKFAGVAYLKLATIATKVEKHRNTVIKAIKLLCELGIVKKELQYREVKGGNGSNFYIIQPFKEANKTAKKAKVNSAEVLRANNESPSVASVDSPKTENETVMSKNYNTKIINKRSKSAYVTLKQYVNAYIGEDKKAVNEFYKIYRCNICHIENSYDKDTLLNIGVQAVKTAFVATKGKRIKNIYGYFNGVMDKLLDRLFYTETAGYLTSDAEF